METIRICYNGWNQDNVDYLSYLIKMSPNLSSLHISGDGIFSDSVDLSAIYTQLIELHDFKLKIDDTTISSHSQFTQFLNFIETDHLYSLGLRNIDQIDLHELSNAISNLRHLEILDLSYNYFENTGSKIVQLINNSRSIFMFKFYDIVGVQDILTHIATHFTLRQPVMILFMPNTSVVEENRLPFANILKKYPQILSFAKKQSPEYYPRLTKYQARNWAQYRTITRYKNAVDRTIRGLYTRGHPRKITSHRSILDIIAYKAYTHDYLELLELLCQEPIDKIKNDDNIIYYISRWFTSLF